MYTAWFDIGGDRFAATTLTVRFNEHGRPSFAGAAPSVPENEIGSIAEVLGPDLGRFEISPELVHHVIREAQESTLLGEQPETWSPLASAARYDEFGRWRAAEQLEAVLDEETPRFAIGDVDSDGHVVISLDVEGERLASFAYDPDAFIVPFPAAVDEVGVTVIDSAADGRLWIRLAAESQASDRDTLILWRVYTGSNSWVRDAVTSARSGAHRLVIKGVRAPGILVGRALRLMSRSQSKAHKDPLQQRRRRAAERKFPEISKACPHLADAPPLATARGIVVVHGTMSTAVALAQAVRDAVGEAARCLRYEHDTWLSLETNAAELAELIHTRIGDRVALIAHSRGGLVAARAAQLLQQSGSPKVTHLLTLGSPFAGTPVALAARGPALANAALMGGLRYLGGPVVDVATRVGGFVLPVDPPAGLRLMYPGNDVLAVLRQFLPMPATTIAGTADGGADRYGPAFVDGVGRGTFGDDPNDLVVSVASAQVLAATHLTVPSDHFSYLEEPDVRNAIRAAAATLPPTPLKVPEHLKRLKPKP
jgi:pimeloyl-ACP methyl ester carboxylesterase